MQSCRKKEEKACNKTVFGVRPINASVYRISVLKRTARELSSRVRDVESYFNCQKDRLFLDSSACLPTSLLVNDRTKCFWGGGEQY